MRDKENIVESVVKFILTRTIEELKGINSTSIAGRLGVDCLDFLQEFEDDQQITLTDFIQREKIYRSGFILEKNSEKSVEELARKLGFQSVEAFSNDFEKIFAVDPGKYGYLRKMRQAGLEIA